MEEVKQSLQETASKELDSYKSVFLKKTVGLQPSKRVHKRIDTKTYHADCRSDYKQTGKHRKFH